MTAWLYSAIEGIKFGSILLCSISAGFVVAYLINRGFLWPSADTVRQMSVFSALVFFVSAIAVALWTRWDLFRESVRRR